MPVIVSQLKSCWCVRLAAGILTLLAALAALPARADVADLRITEVDTWNQQIEVTNFNGGLFQLTSEIPIPYNFDFNNFKQMSIVPGLPFGRNAIFTFEVPELDTYAGDCWLYNSSSYDSPSALIHGVQWGTPPPEKCNSEVAALANPKKWPGKNYSAPAPPFGYTLSWDGDGYTPLDWYVSKSTMGYPNTSPTGTVDDPTLKGPNASQNFETPALGYQVSALKGWTMNTPGSGFHVRFVGDVNGQTGARPGSTSNRWLRIRDTDATGDESFMSPAVQLGAQTGYRCVFYVNQEIAPTMAGAYPTLGIQNSNGSGQWVDAWGIRFRGTTVDAMVMAGGGFGDAAPLYDLTGTTGIGKWVKIELRPDLLNHVLYAAVNDGEPVQLPIAPTGNPLSLRLAYQGGGAGNTQDFLLDDVAFSPWAAPVTAVRGWDSYQ